MSTYQVETFEIEDATHGEASQMAHDAEAAELIEKLGLSGQKSLQNPETLTRCPYPVAEADDLVVYRALNPESCKPEEYSLDCFPVRVMQVLAHAKELNFFTSFAIWYPKSARVDDPVLVGFRAWKRPGQSWDTTDTYILARWGKMLRPLAELRQMAIGDLRDCAISKIAKGMGELTAAAEQAKTTVDLKFLSHEFYVSTP